MTQEEKVTAYDEVVNKLRRFIAQGVDPLITRADAQDFFPELKNTEDERIKKEIIEYIKTGTYRKDWVAWLEKQGQQKPTHDFVEIGGIKWATMNVGANSITDSGLYFQWGDASGYTAEQFGSGEGKKYSYDDAVTAAWGNNWRMPTKDEFKKLLEATIIDWTDDYQDSGVAGLVLTDKTDNSKKLFFPAVGHTYKGAVYGFGDNGGYWYYSSSPLHSGLYFNNYFVDYVDYGSIRLYGHPMRGVLDDKS